MSKILANQIANYGDNSPVEVKEGVNIPAGKPLQAAGVAGMMLLFPGYVDHYVPPNKGVGRSIVAGNLVYS